MKNNHNSRFFFTILTITSCYGNNSNPNLPENKSFQCFSQMSDYTKTVGRRRMMNPFSYQNIQVPGFIPLAFESWQVSEPLKIICSQSTMSRVLHKEDNFSVSTMSSFEGTAKPAG